MTRSEIRTLPLRTRPGLVARLNTAIVEVLTRRRDRRILAQLDAHLLRDIGLSQDEARTEAAKPFWKD
ncbi:MAG: DUF1127 domain-containing protein [Tabrizicola sp.]|jgi:uncharacterized protein YjiS (DUF1127 family)|nr:DUF1127 domain-containing protein [Tabrizicola sp.]